VAARDNLKPAVQPTPYLNRRKATTIKLAFQRLDNPALISSGLELWNIRRQLQVRYTDLSNRDA